MNSSPKISVVIPNYNHAAFLPKRIESVLGQTFQNFEVIFLDDASTDDSRTVFERYAGDPRMRSIFNEVNSGSPFIQWQKGVSEARGDYVWIAESDDFADDRFLETLLPLLEENPDVGLAYCQSWVVNKEDTPIFVNRQWTDDLSQEHWSHSYVNRGTDEIARFLVWKNTIPNASAVLFRKDVALSADAIDSRFTLCGDWLCWIKILLNSDIAFVPENLNFWRQPHTGSVRGTIKSAKRIREILALLKFLQQQEQISPSTLKRVSVKRYREWLYSAVVNGLPWSAHREIAREFEDLLPRIKTLDLAFSPLFLYKAAERRNQ